MIARRLALVLLSGLAACGDDGGNPFGPPVTRPPSAAAALMFVSSSWADDPGEPREIFAANADGTAVERLTNCSQATPPCDVVGFAVAPQRNRVAAIRSSPGGDPAATTLYFMDLDRSVELLLFPRRRVGAVDWSPDGLSLLYQSPGDQPSDDDDLFLCEPNGNSDQRLGLSAPSTPPIRERSPRFDPTSRSAVYERIDETGASRIYVYPAVALTSGPATGPALPETPYFVGGDADPVFSPDATRVVFRRLTGTGNGGLGIWDLLTIRLDGTDLQALATGPAFRGAPDWGPRGIVFVETDIALDESRLVVIQPDGSGRTVLRSERAGFLMAAPRWLSGG